MKIMVLAKSQDDPATRYRVDPLIKKLEERGDAVAVVYEPGISEQLQVLLKVRDFDLVFIQRKLFSTLFTRLLVWRAQRVVFDFDDAIFLRSNGSPSATRRRKFEAMLKHASLVFAGNSYLVQAATEVTSSQVVKLPTAVDVERYPVEYPKEKKITLVWIGSRSTSRYLEYFRETLEAMGKAVPDVRFRVIADFEFSLEHMEVENIPWSSDVEIPALCSSHIGIAPMVEDDWTKGKCALKVIQYLASGLPVISSDVGANRDVVVQGTSGFLVDGTNAWVEALQRLSDSPELREEMGAAARKSAGQGFSIATIVDLQISMLDQMVAS